MSDDIQTGFFGKVPALGDFVQRRMPKDFVDAWDGWLQQAVAASKSRLGEGWLQTYLNSPLWRFALGPNVCGPQRWVGVLMPSVDRVGRYFPLTIAQPLADGASLFALVRLNDWFARAEELALSALDEQGFVLDDFSAAVLELGELESSSAVAAAPGDIADIGAGWQVDLESVADLDKGLLMMLEQLAADRFVSSCLWWTDGADYVAPSFLFSPGLPAPDSFTGLLDGRFGDWAWTSLPGNGTTQSAAVSDVLENL